MNITIADNLHTEESSLRYRTSLDQTVAPHRRKVVSGAIVVGGLVAVTLGLVVATVVHYQIARKLKGMGSAVQALTPILFNVIPIFPTGMVASTLGAVMTFNGMRGDIDQWREARRFDAYSRLSEERSRGSAWLNLSRARLAAIAPGNPHRSWLPDWVRDYQKGGAWVSDPIIHGVRSGHGAFIDVVANEAARLLSEVEVVQQLIDRIQGDLNINGSSIAQLEARAHVAIYRAHLMCASDELIAAWEGFHAAPHRVDMYDRLMAARNRVAAVRFAGIDGAVEITPHRSAGDHYAATKAGEEWSPPSIRDHGGDVRAHRVKTIWTDRMEPDFRRTWVV